MQFSSIKFTLFCMVVSLLVGCQAFGLPKANNAQTAAWEGVGTYTIAAHITNQYLYSPDCTTPITALPCSKPAIRAQIRVTDAQAYDAMLKAVTAIREMPNDPSTAKAKKTADEKIEKLDKLSKSDDVRSTMKGGN